MENRYIEMCGKRLVNVKLRFSASESANPRHEAHEVGSYRVSNPFHLTGLISKSEDHANAPQHLQSIDQKYMASPH